MGLDLKLENIELLVPAVMSVILRTPRGASSRRHVSLASSKAALDAE